MESALPANQFDEKPRELNHSQTTAQRKSDWLSITSEMARGNSEALTQFYEFVFDSMLREITRTSGRDEQTCLDILHEAMLKAIRSIKPLPSKPAVVAWSSAVAKTTTYDWLRRETRLKKLDTEFNRKGPAEVVEMPEHQLDQARLIWLEEQIRELSPDVQRMIGLRYRLGWSLKQIAARAGLKTGAVDGRIRRAIEKLKSKAQADFRD